jgi:putative membrane protein
MIVRPHLTALGLLFIMRGSILPMIAPRIGVVVLISAGVALFHQWAPRHFPDITTQPFTLLGLALSIFLGFRNNACYERWWEGRKQWGQLVAEARGLFREVMTLFPDDAPLKRRFVHRGVAFAHALRCQLRETNDRGEEAWMPEGERHRLASCRSRPDVIMLAQADELRALLSRGALSDIPYQILSERLMAMTTIQTACERLRSAPMPFTYKLLLHRTAWMFCLLLPFGMVGAIGLATPIITAILAYAFFGLDALGEELEEPFTNTQNGLPLDAMVRAIEIASGEALHDEVLPEALLPREYVLL